MKMKEFYQEVEKRKTRLLEENEVALNEGDKNRVQCNANVLVGISFVMELLKKVS